MKKIITALFAAALVSAVGAKEIKVLSIGNSFSQSVQKPLRAIVGADKENKILIDGAAIGGCPMEKHWKLHEKGEKPYRKKSLTEKLTEQKWDIVTIQQASLLSWDEKSYQPYADNLISLIQKLAPQAEIVIQQTWSYRNDATHLKKWGFDQNAMYDKLTANYQTLAAKHHLRIIPTGFAVQLYRKSLDKQYEPLTKAQEAQFVDPAVPSSEGDVVGKYVWRKNAKSGKRELKVDNHHLNAAGAYMQGCLWYFFLYGDRPVNYVPKGMKEAEAKKLQDCARQALKEFPQNK